MLAFHQLHFVPEGERQREKNQQIQTDREIDISHKHADSSNAYNSPDEDQLR